MSGHGRLALLAVALTAGVAIALVDDSQGWDSTGITAGALALAAAASAFLGRSRPWLWALAVGGPLVVIEAIGRGDLTIALALGFAAVGAAVGWGVRRTLAEDAPRPG